MAKRRHLHVGFVVLEVTRLFCTYVKASINQINTLTSCKFDALRLVPDLPTAPHCIMKVLLKFATENSSMRTNISFKRHKFDHIAVPSFDKMKSWL